MNASCCTTIVRTLCAAAAVASTALATAQAHNTQLFSSRTGQANPSSLRAESYVAGQYASKHTRLACTGPNCRGASYDLHRAVNDCRRFACAGPGC
jgi:hypothetical protein